MALSWGYVHFSLTASFRQRAGYPKNKPETEGSGVAGDVKARHTVPVEQIESAFSGR
jgi:hypothetical protein